MGPSQEPTPRRPDDRSDIAVVGGGLAGLVTALALHRAGWSVVLVAPSRQPDGRTTALLGESVETMRSLGVWDAVAHAAQPLRGIRIIDATDRLIRAPEVLFDAAEIGAEAFGYNVPNEPLLAALDAALHAAGVRRLAAAATGSSRSFDTVIVKTADSSVEARLVVAADGRHSTIRKDLGIAFKADEPTQGALVCNLRHTEPHQDISTEFHTAQGPFTLVPLPGRRSALVWVMPLAEAERLGTLPPRELAERIETNARSILGAMALEGAVQTFPLVLSVAERLVGNRAVLIGEAAHVLPPIAAQGFNLTLRDVVSLVRALHDTADPGDAEPLAAYARERRRDIAGRKLAVGLLNRSLLSAALPVQAIRAIGLLGLARIPLLRRALIRQGLGA